MLKPNNKYTSFYPYAFAALLIILCCIYFYHDIIDLFPTFIHAWTQSDRLAIAMNFQENGFDFFHPATFNLITKHGITQVDFPIHDYLVACFSSLFDADMVSTFRLYNLVYSLIGLYFIYRLALMLCSSRMLSFCLSFFVFSLPFYAYYQAGFLPSIPSFANLFIGLYFLFSYHKDKRLKHFYWAVFFLVLAGLSRMPFVIFLVAAILLEAINWYRSKKIDTKEFIPFVIGFAAIAAYFLYNQHLSAKYGSMFLQFLLPITSFTDFAHVAGNFIDRWSNSLFGLSHFVFVIAVLLIGIVQINKKGFLSQLQLKLALYFLISGSGVLLFFILMGKQYIDHDYYLIDTFLPLLVFALIIAMSSIHYFMKWKKLNLFLISVFVLAFAFEGKKLHDDRYEIPYNDVVHFSYEKYASTAGFIEDWGINKNDTVIFIGAFSTNIPLITWKRRGYTILNTSEDSIKKYLAKPFQYAVLLDTFRVEEVIRNYKGIMYNLDRIHGYNGLAVYAPTENKNEIGFFGHFIHFQQLDFETAVESDRFSANTKIDYPNDTSSLSLEILPIHEYSLSFSKEINSLKPDKDLHVVVQADYLNQMDSSGINLVCQIDDSYHSRYFASELKNSPKWQNHQSHFKIPSREIGNGQELKVYYWNHGKSELYIDNYSILIFQ